MSIKSEILKELKMNQNTYISGQELCQRLGVSRTAIWKHMKALKEAGYKIESVSNRGYCLVDTPDILGKEEISMQLHTSWLGSDIKYHEVIDSTNLEAKRLAEAGAGHGTLVVADRQDAGRGRRGRTWESPEGVGVSMSFILKPDIEIENSSMLTLVTALAVHKAIFEVTGIDSKIKWPNDLILNGKKVCGILTELSAQMDELNYMIVGIGINVNMSEFPKEVEDVATSLFIDGNKKVNRSQLIGKVLENFEKYYEIFLQTSDLSQLKDEYNDNLVHLNQKVFVIRQKQQQEVMSLGINEKGELLVEDSLHRVDTVLSGEVSIRGILGYI